MSHNAPYRHFSSKQDILEALIAREIVTMCETAESAETPLSVQALTLVFADWALMHAERFRLLIQQWPHGERDDLRQAMERWDILYTRATQTDQQAGALPSGDPQRLSYLIRSTTLGSIQHYLAAGRTDVPEPAQIIDDLFHHLGRSAQA